LLEDPVTQVPEAHVLGYDASCQAEKAMGAVRARDPCSRTCLGPRSGWRRRREVLREDIKARVSSDEEVGERVLVG